MRLRTHFVLPAVLLCGMLVLALPVRSIPFAAQIFDGPGLTEGIDLADNVADIPSADDPTETVVRLIESVLNVVALLAVIMIIIAGLYLIVSMGNDEQRDKAKRIIIYTLIGLIVILCARIIVGLITVYLAQQIT